MKVYHRPDIDFASIDFKEGVEARSVFENGMIIRSDADGNVLGLDITDSSAFFAQGSEDLTLQEACRLLGVSESTLRRKLKAGALPFRKPNKKDYLLKRKDVLALRNAG